MPNGTLFTLLVTTSQRYKGMDLSYTSPQPLPPVAGLLAEPLLDAGAQCFLVVQPVETLQDAALMSLVLVTTRVDLRDERVEVRVSAQRTSGDQLLPAGGAFFVPAGVTVKNHTFKYSVYKRDIG